MKMNNKKNYLSRIFIFFILLLFAMGLTMNVFFGSNTSTLTDKTTVVETRVIPESTVSDGDGVNTAHFKASFLSENNSHTETITKSTCPMPIIAAIPQGFGLYLFIVIVFLYFFSTLFRLLPDEWTLMNQKVRLDD